MSNFEIHFELTCYEQLDQFALLACQDYNLGGKGDWFGCFRGGLYGFYSRLYGVRRHYHEVHEWLPRLRAPEKVEYHLTSILFHMDSSLECLTFALNALGWIALPADFQDVTDFRTLKNINPLNVIGRSTAPPSKPPISGYQTVFPTVQSKWQQEAPMIARICDLHDVSKHRETIYVGGQLRMDTPEHFYRTLGVENVPVSRTLLSPMAEILLKREPKLPRGQRASSPSRNTDLLEDLVPSFSQFIHETGTAAIQDAKANIPLTESQFRTR